MELFRLRYPLYIQLLAMVLGVVFLPSCGAGARSSTRQSQPPVITNPDAATCGTPPCALTPATENLAYTFTFSASSGVPPYTWSVASATGLPTGLSLSSSGCGSDVNCTLQGTPSGESYPVKHTFTVTVADSASNQATLLVSLTAYSSSSGNGIPVTFFGMHINQETAPWPIVGVGAQRLHDSGVSWAEIETSNGNYDFTKLDRLTTQAQAKGVDLLYTFVDVPAFYSSVPTDTTCAYPLNGNGGCDPPSDLNADGTGTNQSFKNFVTAVATHVGSKITYWEIWNEPDVLKMWKGSPQQLVRMAQDARCIIKGTGSGCTASAINAQAQMLTPAPTSGPNVVPQWMQTYLAAGGGQYADVISFHGYVQCPVCPTQPTPEVITDTISNLKAVLVSNGQQGKPIFDSEASWGSADRETFNDPDQRSAFVARFLVLQQSAGVARFYWYRWDVGGSGFWGTLWDKVNTNQEGCNGAGIPYQSGYLCKPGAGYAQVYGWLLDATLSTPCTANGTVWTCGYSRANGYQAQIVWDTSQTCSGGVCATTPYTAGAQYKQYRDLSGTTTAITSGTVPIGAKPVILETGTP